MRLFVITIFMLLIGLTSGCAARHTEERACGEEQNVHGIMDKSGSEILTVQQFAVIGDNLRLDYLVGNPFHDDIWICDDLSIYAKRRASERNAETRIADTTLWIRLHERLQRNMQTDAQIAKYRRLPPGNFISAAILLPVPVDNRSPVSFFGFGAYFGYSGHEAQVIIHRAVFELGYFKENLPAMLSDDTCYPRCWAP